MDELIFQPDFDCECSICGATPTVTVIGHMQPDTELCGPCFFSDKMMIDWALWNEQSEGTE